MLKKYNKILLLIGSLVAILSLSCTLFIIHTDYHYNNRFVKNKTVTLFVHGYGSSLRAEQYMVHGAEKAGVTGNVLRAYVNRIGNVKLIGKIGKDDYNSIVEVNFADNKHTNPFDNAVWIKNVITKLQQKDQVEKINLVGHSMGNTDIACYLLEFGNDKELPQIQKQVVLAGGFNGVLQQKNSNAPLNKFGKQTKETDIFKILLPLRHLYPRNLKVLNVYGNLNNRDSDTTIGNNSSKSLRYLINNRVKSYQEKEITGNLAEHSDLHHNPQVNKLLIDFLWKK